MKYVIALLKLLNLCRCFQYCSLGACNLGFMYTSTDEHWNPLFSVLVFVISKTIGQYIIYTDVVHCLVVHSPYQMQYFWVILRFLTNFVYICLPLLSCPQFLNHWYIVRVACTSLQSGQTLCCWLLILTLLFWFPWNWYYTFPNSKQDESIRQIQKGFHW